MIVNEGSLADQINSMSDEERAVFWSDFTEEEMDALIYDANFWLRPKQKVPDGDWFITAIIAGRGFGKSRTASEWVRRKALEKPGCRFAIAGRTVADVRNTMVMGEALALDTEVVTPTGFTTMRDIKVGDVIIGGGGKPCTVTKVYPVLHNRPCFEVNISGQKVVADADHKWLTWDFKSRVSLSEGRLRTKFKKSVVTTQQIKDSLKIYGQNNHGILSTKLEGVPTELPVDPYLLGYWLGDGTSKGSSITVHDDDKENIWDSVIRAGYIPTNTKTKYSMGITKGFLKDLRELGLYKNKHIPAVYLRASYEDRLQLLRGLMDSDGSVMENGYMEFSNKNPRLIAGTFELASTLGIRVREASPNADGQVRLNFTTSIPVFQLKRKLDRVKEYRREDDWKYISGVEAVPTVPVRCIEVDSDDHTFLITRSMVRTHNSGILAVHPPEDRPEYKAHTASLHWPNGSQALLLSSESPDGARGPQFDYAVGDEFAAWKTTVDSSGATLFSNMIAATRLGDNPQILLATTPKKTQVMRDLMEQAKDPERRIKIVSGSTLDNKSLSQSYIKNLLLQYGDSDLAKQEIDGMMLEDAEGLVFTTAMIEKARTYGTMPSNLRKIIAVDPSVSGDPRTADECGIMVIGVTNESNILQRRAFVIEDGSLKAAPDIWAERIAELAKKYRVTNVVAEANQGGALIESVIKTKSASLKVHLVHATKGKVKRVEPIVVAMQQGRVKLVEEFPLLEDQLLYYDPEISGSPDRMDAFAWGCTALLVAPPKGLNFGGFHTESAKGRTLGASRQTSAVRRKMLNSYR